MAIDLNNPPYEEDDEEAVVFSAGDLHQASASGSREAVQLHEAFGRREDHLHQALRGREEDHLHHAGGSRDRGPHQVGVTHVDVQAPGHATSSSYIDLNLDPHDEEDLVPGTYFEVHDDPYETESSNTCLSLSFSY